MKELRNTHFTIESWNHSAFGEKGKNYPMVWPPMPIDQFYTETITKNLQKFDPNVRFIKYRHPNLAYS